jgi:uncharacterized repeat protein (TIGR03803 family)
VKKLSLPEMVCVVFVFCAATAIASSAQILTTLHSFDGADGARLVAALIQATDGNFYGTTWAGGSTNCSPGCGTIFKLTSSGVLTTLYSFCPQPNCADGAFPQGALVQATDGNFYGTTVAGGTSGNCSGVYAPGCGTVFKLTPSGTLTTLYSFCPQPNCADGADPVGGLTQAADGNFYGTAEWGGAYNVGTVFKVTPGGTLTTLHSFCSQPNCADGQSPNGLVQATDGNFYGPTIETVYKITPSGTLTTLHSFDGADGSEPEGRLVQASDGNLYGTTYYGGPNCESDGGCGTIFKMTLSGTLTTLYSFAGQPDGSYPSSGLIQATDANFYGTTQYGGAYNYGTIFKITPGGKLTILHSFDGRDGELPAAGLIQATDGNYYGTTAEGGTNGDGTVFRLKPVAPCSNCQSK